MPNNYLEVYYCDIYWKHRPAGDHSLKLNNNLNQDMTLGMNERFCVSDLVLLSNLF